MSEVNIWRVSISGYMTIAGNTETDARTLAEDRLMSANDYFDVVEIDDVSSVGTENPEY